VQTAPFASFSGRTEKEGPARPERIPISSSIVQGNQKSKRNAEMLQIVLMQRYPFFDKLKR